MDPWSGPGIDQASTHAVSRANYWVDFLSAASVFIRLDIWLYNVSIERINIKIFAYQPVRHH